MNKGPVISGGLAIGIIVVVVLVVAVVGYIKLGGGRKGEKPVFSDPQVNQMYSRHSTR